MLVSELVLFHGCFGGDWGVANGGFTEVDKAGAEAGKDPTGGRFVNGAMAAELKKQMDGQGESVMRSAV